MVVIVVVVAVVYTLCLTLHREVPGKVMPQSEKHENNMLFPESTQALKVVLLLSPTTANSLRFLRYS
jgi:hypothetical protein